MKSQFLLQSKRLMSLVVASKTLLRCQFEIRKELQNNIRYHGTSSSSSRVCSRCGSPLHSCCAIFCPSINCSYIQPIDCGDCKCNYFELFSLDSTKFDIDIIDLENKFRNLQKRVHPDKLVSTLDNDGIDVARRNSSFINQVYQTLKHPLSRAIYMLSLHGIQVDEEGKTLKDPTLTMEVFELRQELEDLVAQYANQNSSSSSIGDVSNSNVSSSNSSDDANSSTNSMTTNQSLPKPVIEFGHRIEHSIANLQSQLSALFAMGDYQAATTITIRLKYMEKALEEYREKFNL